MTFRKIRPSRILVNELLSFFYPVLKCFKYLQSVPHVIPLSTDMYLLYIFDHVLCVVAAFFPSAACSGSFFNTKTKESVPGVDTETREGSHCPSGGIPPLCSACMGTMPFMAFLCPFPLPSQPQSSLSSIPSPQSFVSELASETNRNVCFTQTVAKV